MKLSQLFGKNKQTLAFEIFPPKPEVPMETLFESIPGFKELSPDYISVTYGAGGSSRGRTVEIASRLKNTYGIEAMAHLTCVGHTMEQIDEILDSLKRENIENILALRGDPPIDQPDFDFSRGDFRHANELIAHIRKVGDFCIAAAAYLEGHVDSKRLDEDRRWLKEKVDAGVDFLITQLFFDNRLYFDFLDRAAQIGINCPIVPGIMPIFNAKIKTMTARSGCSIPAKLVLMIDKYQDNPEDLRKAGIEYAAKQIRELLDGGAPGIHLYTMNRLKSTIEILKAAGLR
ncbi:MAG TPA: methylenetetrahydrofolate reductase [NAD(P)H] [Thermoclostridium caenicola]|uniref:methylenetetrahydrofolate reductase [NAD(P)H] n=1 Tax=Thermoclostridium caenicola TaxID=659425 RepID=UPI002C39B329|nr:methylenetetrahydrofolate reductase [NAD(P)H] [Thermoclostridium caenicola]HOK44068.1 methylenetetrahydrofolate reductase [NAD(P)H] [Thermoclostridium caenicola]HOL85705.1 methylenetetrahydrofolate reductase [NAD(P)H] [Thermoclostridium caenicola]HOP72199.1 methylenetetrahydrofolate reductase [NAD(P)H] [Thermoclostridium caenicola]HPO78018.1 methylenetetrahydrofolate reductase [NAD(P)H] [Thermoclostridium caenicola]